MLGSTGMRLSIVLLLVVSACEKSGPVESSSGSSAPRDPVVAAPVGPKDQVTMPNDAGVAVVADAAAAAPDASLVAARDAARRRAVDIALQEAEAIKIADLLTADSGTSQGDMTKRRPGADLGSQIQDVREGGKSVAVRGGTGRQGNGDPGAVAGMGTGPSGPTGRISMSSKKAVGDTTLTADLVLMKIQSVYMAGIRRCYKIHLTKDPAARGTMTLSVSVESTGRSVNPQAKSFASEIDACITGQMASWRFPVPKDKDGEPTTASFEIGLQLVPD